MTIDMLEVYPWFWISDGRHYSVRIQVLATFCVTYLYAN